jgi:Teichoic acid biosynthesis proteins
LTLQSRITGNVLGAHIDAISWEGALGRLLGWARGRESRTVTICNVHVVVSASQDAGVPRHHQWLGHGHAGRRAGGLDAAAAGLCDPAAHQRAGCDVGAVRGVAMPGKCGQDALGMKGGRVHQGRNSPVPNVQ